MMKTFNWIIIKSEDRGTVFGVGSFIRHFAKELAMSSDVQVIILEIGSTKSSFIQASQTDGIITIKVRQNGSMAGIDSKSNQIKIARSIARAVKSYIPEAVNNVVHLNFSYQIFIGQELLDLLGGQLIFTQHITPFNREGVGVADQLDAEVFREVSEIIAVTENGKDNLIKRFAPPQKITTIYNGIDPVLFNENKKWRGVRKKYGIREADKIVLYSGRLDEGKGVKFLLEAFGRILDQLPDCHLVLAGDGNYKEIVEYSRSFSSQISILGFLPFEDLMQLYQEAIIGVIPSLQEECSYVALEMLHSGLPVIATKVGGLKEIFTHGKEGLLIDIVPNSNGVHGFQPDVKQLTDKMVRLLTCEELREEMKRLALQKANSMFTAQAMVNKYKALVNQIN